MIRTIVIGLGGLLVMALAVWSDQEWRSRQQARRDVETVIFDDPDLTAEVRASRILRRP
jgi:hypothetical protein